MMRKTVLAGLIALGLLSGNVQAEDKDKMCDGNFVNPISDICWECTFPMTIGDVSVFDGDAPDTENPSMPLQICPWSLWVTVSGWPSVTGSLLR